MSDINIHSHKRTNNFTIIPNHIINAEYLSLEEKMLLIWILSKPSDWSINTRSLATSHNIGKNKVTQISKTLQESSHLLIEKTKEGKCIWHVFENPSDCLNLEQSLARKLDTKPNPQNRDKGFVQKTNDLVQMRRASPLKLPDPQKPDLANGDALLRTDLIQRTNTKRSCSSDDEPSFAELEFDRLWLTWHKKQNKKDSRRAFLKAVKGKSEDAIREFANQLIQDSSKRRELKQSFFLEMLLSTYINKERYLDELTTPINHQQPKKSGLENFIEKRHEQMNGKLL